jgi:hypothetical protein
MKRLFSVMAAMGCLVATGWAGDGAKKPEKPEGEAFTVPIPVGHEAKGIKFPWYGEEGKLEMTFAIGTAKRLDDRYLEMKNLEVETYDESGASSLLIRLPRSVLDLSTRVLTADDEPVVSRSDFEITGDALEFDTRTRLSRFTGKTRMLIYEATGGLVGK